MTVTALPRPAPVWLRSVAGAALGLLALATTASTLEAADTKSCANEPVKTAFAEGAWCFEKKQWEAAVPWLEAAVEENPTAQVDVVFSLYGGLAVYYYLPYYYLGRSFYEIPDCPAAVQHFDRSEDQAEIQGKDVLYDRLKLQRLECRAAAALPAASAAAETEEAARE